MKTWKLTPKVVLKHQGYVRIRASTEDRARKIAAELFIMQAKRSNVAETEWSTIPWSDPNAVECVCDGDDILGDEGVLDIV